MASLMSGAMSLFGITVDEEEDLSKPSGQIRRSPSPSGDFSLDLNNTKRLQSGLATDVDRAKAKSPNRSTLAVVTDRTVRRAASDIQFSQSAEEDPSFLSSLFSFIRLSDNDPENTPEAGPVVFGVGSLSDLPLKHDIPHIIAACLEYLYTTEAYLEEGLFRIGGNVTNIRQLKAELTFAGDDIVIDEELVPNPHDVTGLIKSFFRELGEPLLTNLLYPDFMTVKKRTNVVSEQVAKLTSLVAKLPTLHRMVLKRILYFVRFVSEFEDVNRMGVTNLATTLGPTLLGKQDDIMNVATSVSLLSTMLEHFDTIFGEYRTLPFEKRHINMRKAAKESLTTPTSTATTASVTASPTNSVEDQVNRMMGLTSPCIKETEDDDEVIALPIVTMVDEPAEPQETTSRQIDDEELCKSHTVVEELAPVQPPSKPAVANRIPLMSRKPLASAAPSAPPSAASSARGRIKGKSKDEDAAQTKPRTTAPRTQQAPLRPSPAQGAGGRRLTRPRISPLGADGASAAPAGPAVTAPSTASSRPTATNNVSKLASNTFVTSSSSSSTSGPASSKLGGIVGGRTFGTTKPTVSKPPALSSVASTRGSAGGNDPASTRKTRTVTDPGPLSASSYRPTSKRTAVTPKSPNE